MIVRAVAHYRITAKLGEGGVSEAHHATDTKLRREVAIKILPSPSPRMLGA
jgi:serine/threonine-protein kinase